ncbi:MAG: spondin domain-containing protein [Bacteriovoracia bacterium]
MKTFKVLQMGAVVVQSAFVSLSATAATTYQLTVTNGSAMPISPAVVYVKDGAVAGAQIGATPTRGLVQLCQTGNPATRAEELGAEKSVKSVVRTDGPILPGQSRTVEVMLAAPERESVRFEAMYGKTKDVCATFNVSGHALQALKLHVTSELSGRDEAIQTGAFLSPMLPKEGYGEAEGGNEACAKAADAVGCLRELAMAFGGAAKVNYFSGYLPSVVSFLEGKYGAAAAQELVFSTAGAVQYQVKLKH